MRRIAVKIFAKVPLPGLAKTRLAPALGADGAAQVAEALLRCSLTLSRNLPAQMRVEFQLSPEPQAESWQSFTFMASACCRDQGDGDLGQRLRRAAQRGLAEADAVILIGTDCPGLEPAHFDWVGEVLVDSDAALIPACDGGYVLLALRRMDARLFAGVDWSTAAVAEQTRQRLAAAGFSWRELAPLPDLDSAGDIAAQPPAFIARCAPLRRYREMGGG